MAKFNPGDHVAWSHILGSIHAEGSILKKSAVPSIAAHHSEGEPPCGVVKSVANPEETWFIVEFEGGETRTLTGDELVRVALEE